MSSRAADFQDRTSAELVQEALREQDEDARWDLVKELQRRGSRQELELARALCESGEDEQRLACEILSQLGFTHREMGAYPFGADAAALVARGLRSPAVAVQAAAIMAAGHLRWEPLMREVIALAKSPSEEVRYAVAFALGGRTDDDSVRALVALSSDTDPDVRNWATFGIGTQCERKDALVCDALAQRIADEHDETRGEAWVGLASKGDMRAFEPVLASLRGDVLRELAIEAAEAYGSPEFLPALEAWLRQCDEPEDAQLRASLTRAIEACRAGARA